MKIDKIIKVCDFIIKSFIYLGVFLTPLFFLPITNDILDFNKQTFLVFLVFISLFCWILRSLLSKRINIKIGPINIAIILFFISSLLSTIFSISRYGSFWGWPQSSAENFITILVLCIFSFLVINALHKKQALFVIKIFVISIALVDLWALLILYKNSLGFGLISPAGSYGSVGILSSILIPIAVTLLILGKRLQKVLMVVCLLIYFILILFINYNIAWIGTICGSAFLIVMSIFGKKIFDLRWMALPVLLLGTSLFFLILNPQIGWLPRVSPEIFLSAKTSAAIDSEVLKTNLVLGSGLGTFSYDFLKFKGEGLSAGPLWNLVFDKAQSKILTILATTGILGAILYLYLFVLTIFSSAKFLISESVFDQEDRNHHWILVSGLVAAMFCFLISSFFYGFNLTLDFTGFLILGLIFNLIIQNVKEIHLHPNSFSMLISVFIFTVIFMFGMGILVIQAERYLAEVNYANGLKYMKKGSINNAVLSMEKSITTNSIADLYFSQISQVYLAKLKNDLQDQSISKEIKEKEIKTLSSNAFIAAQRATELNSQNSNNWSVKGFIAQNLIPISKEMQKISEDSYRKAIELNPFDPYLRTQLGILYYQKKDYEGALKIFKEVKNLNQSYALNLYYLGLTYDKRGAKNSALAEFNILLRLTQNSKEIQKIIDNLNAGRGALEDIASVPVVTPESKDIKIPAKSTNN